MTAATPLRQIAVTMAAIAGAHGVTGDVRLKLFGEGAAALKRYRTFQFVRGNGKDMGSEASLTVEQLRDDGKGGAIARFAEITDRNGAEALRGTALTVPRHALPPLAEDEYYHADLIGLPAVSTTGAALGMVVAVENFGAGDLIEIEGTDAEGKSHRFLVPMRVDGVSEWDHLRVVVADGWAE